MPASGAPHGAARIENRADAPTAIVLLGATSRSRTGPFPSSSAASTVTRPPDVWFQIARARPSSSSATSGSDDPPGDRSIGGCHAPDALGRSAACKRPSDACQSPTALPSPKPASTTSDGITAGVEMGTGRDHVPDPYERNAASTPRGPIQATSTLPVVSMSAFGVLKVVRRTPTS